MIKKLIRFSIFFNFANLLSFKEIFAYDFEDPDDTLLILLFNVFGVYGLLFLILALLIGIIIIKFKKKTIHILLIEVLLLISSGFRG